MKNNTASNKLGKLVIREQFEAITGVVLNAQTLYRAMTQCYDDEDERFRDALRKAFAPFELTCDMRRIATWVALASAIAQYNSLSTVEAPIEAAETTSECSQPTYIENAPQPSTNTSSDSERVIEESPLEVWHQDDLNWREDHVKQMGEWHPHFGKVEWKFRRAVGFFPSVLKDYAVTLLSETTDDADDLLRHLHEEVVDYLTNKLVEAVDDAWREATAATLRPDSSVKQFEELIEECRAMLSVSPTSLSRFLYMPIINGI